MEILLRKDVEKLGKAGEIVRVTAGYARNYLFPRKIASEVTQDNLSQLEAEQRRAEREAERHHQELAALAKKLEATSCTIAAQATESGTLFGSVTAHQVVEALKTEGYLVEERAVRLEEAIKETGVYAVEIHLAPDIVATTRVWVVED
jgi:large subunit ribosomal protein L9